MNPRKLWQTNEPIAVTVGLSALRIAEQLPVPTFPLSRELRENIRAGCEGCEGCEVKDLHFFGCQWCQWCQWWLNMDWLDVAWMWLGCGFDIRSNPKKVKRSVKHWCLSFFFHFSSWWFHDGFVGSSSWLSQRVEALDSWERALSAKMARLSWYFSRKSLGANFCCTSLNIENNKQQQSVKGVFQDSRNTNFYRIYIYISIIYRCFKMNQSPMISPCLHHLRTPFNSGDLLTPDDRCPEDPRGTPSRLWPRIRLFVKKLGRCLGFVYQNLDIWIDIWWYLDRYLMIFDDIWIGLGMFSRVLKNFWSTPYQPEALFQHLVNWYFSKTHLMRHKKRNRSWPHQENSMEHNGSTCFRKKAKAHRPFRSGKRWHLFLGWRSCHNMSQPQIPRKVVIFWNSMLNSILNSMEWLEV